MPEYIRREDAIKCIEGQCVDGKMWGNDESEGTLIEAYSAIEDLMDIPAADVAPVRHGRWVEYENEADKGFHYCSECKGQAFNYEECEETVEVLPPWCHNCGAKMDLEE